MTAQLSPQEALDTAILSENGIELEFSSPAAAYAFRHKCYRFRQQDIEASKLAFPITDPRYGQSPYTILSISLTDNKLSILKNARPTGWKEL